MSKAVPFQTIQFSISMQLILFNPQIGPYQVFPFWARVDLGAIAIKGCSAFPKAPTSLEPAVGVFYSPSRLGKHTVK